MNAVVFHGVPQGHDVFGGAKDNYYESFYNIGDSFKGAKTVFVVEVRKDASGFCSYYSYIRPQNVVAHSGRNGSYFGMSLKVVGKYCTDVYSLFQLFDRIYEEKIIGTVIQRGGNSEQYIITSFADVEYPLKTIAQLADNQIRTNFEHDFEDIDDTFTKQFASTSVYYNLDDVNSEAFFNATRVYGKVFISPEYASKDELIATLSSSDKKYQALKTDLEKQIADLQKENAQIPDLKSNLVKIQKENENLVKQNQEIQNTARSLMSAKASLEQQLTNSRQECEHLKHVTNIGQVADRLEPSLNELLGIMRSIKPSQAQSARLKDDHVLEEHRHSSHRHHKSKDQGLLRYLPFVLVFFLALLLAFFLWRGIKSGPRIKALKKENAALIEKNENLNNEVSTLQAEIGTAKSQDFFRIVSKDEKYQDISFEITDESSAPVLGPLQLGKKYMVRCTGIDQEGEWRADGFTIVNKRINPVSVQVIKADRGILSFYIKNERAISIEYQVNN
jgi:cell division protein FtsB